ncbi:MAG: hypothetical protein ABFS30_13555 [Pseudomonadota bacterium]
MASKKPAQAGGTKKTKTAGAGWSLVDLTPETKAAVREAAAKQGVAPGAWVNRELLGAARRILEPEKESSSDEELGEKVAAFTEKVGSTLGFIGRQIRDEARTAFDQLSDKNGEAPAKGKSAAPKSKPTPKTTSD